MFADACTDNESNVCIPYPARGEAPEGAPRLLNVASLARDDVGDLAIGRVRDHETTTSNNPATSVDLSLCFRCVRLTIHIIAKIGPCRQCKAAAKRLLVQRPLIDAASVLRCIKSQRIFDKAVTTSRLASSAGAT